MSDPKEIFSELYQKNGLFVCGKAGFGFARLKFENNFYHFGITSANNSAAHKQDDELAIFLEINGEAVVLEPGYTDFDDNLRDFLRSRSAHSTFELMDFSSRMLDLKSKKVPEKQWVRRLKLQGFKGFYGYSELQDGNLLQRIIGVKQGIGFVVIDFFTVDAGLSIHNFIIPAGDTAKNKIELVYPKGFEVLLTDTLTSSTARDSSQKAKKVSFQIPTVKDTNNILCFVIAGEGECLTENKEIEILAKKLSELQSGFSIDDLIGIL